MEKLDVTMLKPILGLGKCIDKILESCSLKPGVSDICKKYKDALQNTDEVMLYESFVSEIRPFNGLDAVNAQLQKIERLAEAEKINISILKNLAAVNQEGNIGKVFESDVVNYLVNKTNPTMSALRGRLEAFKGDRNVDAILESVTEDEYTQRLTNRTSKLELNESAQPTEVLYTKEEVDKIVSQKVDEAVAEANKKVEEVKVKHISDLGSLIKLEESIDRIKAAGAHNNGLVALCEQYKNYLSQGYSELALYEGFISAGNDYSYINGVDTELSALKDRIEKVEQDIDLTKIVDKMRETESYFIVPHIEEAVAQYMKDKNATSRFMLRTACQPFMYDDYVKNIIRVVDKDTSISNLFHGSVVESAETNKLSIKKILSPVLYIKESECIFNVGGVYYDRKGQTVSKLSKANIENLSESFKAACNVLNSGRVSYDADIDSLIVESASNGYKAIINESGLSINGTQTDPKALFENENLLAYERYCGNGQFYDDIKAICESYDTITDISFVKRVSLNESNKSVDLFRIKNTICLALNEGESSTFYRNVNPLQCKNYINEHMSINASKMFESLMPNQKVIESEIEDSKKAYEAYIEELKSKKKELQTLKESGETDDDDAIDKAIGLIDKELDDIVGDYKEYQKNADEFTGQAGASGEDNSDGSDKKEDDKEAPADVKNDVVDPLGDEAEKNGEETVNPDGATGDDAAQQDATVDSTEQPQETIEPISYEEFDGILNTPKSDGNFEVVKVSFDKNVKNGKTSGKGSVIVMTPTVNSNGDVKDEITTLTFSLDPSTKKPIVNNDHMPLSMYNAIVDAISASPEIDTIELGAEEPAGVPAEGGETTPVLPDVTPTVGDDTATTLPSLPTEPNDAATAPTVPPTNGEAEPLKMPETQDDLTSSVTSEPTGTDSLDSHVTPEDTAAAAATSTDTDDNKEEDNVEELIPFKEDEGYVSVAQEDGPIEVGVFAEDVSPLSLKDFAEELAKKELVYKLAKDKETGKDAVVITCETRADVIALRKFFEHIYNTSPEKFFEAFPELKCFESFAYKKADMIYRKLYEAAADDDDSVIVYDLPYSPDLADELKKEKYITKEYVDELTPESDTISVELKEDQDINELCDVLWDFIRGLEVSEFRTELINAVTEFSTTTIPVLLPMEEGLLNELDKKGLIYDYTDGNEEDVYVFISSEEEKEDIFNICDKLGIDTSEDGPLAELDKWTESLEDTKEDVNEGLKITVEDTENHKKVTFDTDDLDADKKDETDKSEEEKDGDSGFGNDTELYNTKEEAQQAADNNGNGDQNQNGDQNESQADEPKKKVKFRFKPRKVNESAIAALGVGDTVKYKGRTGRITEKRPGGEFVVLVQGATIICKEGDLVPVTVRMDSADFPHKFDKTTLKNLNAQ